MAVKAGLAGNCQKCLNLAGNRQNGRNWLEMVCKGCGLITMGHRSALLFRETVAAGGKRCRAMTHREGKLHYQRKPLGRTKSYRLNCQLVPHCTAQNWGYTAVLVATCSAENWVVVHCSACTRLQCTELGEQNTAVKRTGRVVHTAVVHCRAQQ